VVPVLAETLSASIVGVEGLPVRVEVDVAFGLPVTIVASPEPGTGGSQRVRRLATAASRSAPHHHQPVMADLPKDGTGYSHRSRSGPRRLGQMRSVDQLRDTAGREA
jgi:hypothetical protein